MNQTEKIINLLEKRGKRGASNYELNKIAFRYSARLHELRKEGYKIKAQHIKDSLWKFELVK